jgi:hypothetical protein
MGFLKHLLPLMGVCFAVVGASLVVAPQETVSAVYGGKTVAGSLLAWTTRGAFEFGFGMLAIFSRNWLGAFNHSLLRPFAAPRRRGFSPQRDQNLSLFSIFYKNSNSRMALRFWLAVE